MSSFAIPLYLSLPVKSKQKYSARRRNEKKAQLPLHFCNPLRLGGDSGPGVKRRRPIPGIHCRLYRPERQKDTLQYGIHSIKKGPVPMHRSLLFIHFFVRTFVFFLDQSNRYGSSLPVILSNSNAITTVQAKLSAKNCSGLAAKPNRLSTIIGKRCKI